MTREGGSGGGMGRSGAPLRLALEGNIAVGKSTFLQLLAAAFPRWHLVTEPVAQWQKVPAGGKGQATVGSTNLLQMMYKEPARWSYTFQTFSCLSRLKALLEPPPHSFPTPPVRVFERSIYSDRRWLEVPWVMGLSPGELGWAVPQHHQILQPLEWAIYQEWHSFLLQQLGPRATLQGFLYLRAEPRTCLDRLRRRARSEEGGIQLGYLEQLHSQHDQWLLEKTTEIHFPDMKNVPVLVLDVDKDFEHDVAARDVLMAQVEAFATGLQAALPSHPDPL